MSDEIERLLVRVEANAQQFEAQMKRVNRALYGSAAEVRKTRQQFKSEMAALGRDVYVPVQAASALALGAITAFSYQAAKRAEAVGGAFEQTFRDMPAEARKAVEAISNDFGRLETDIKDNFTQLRSVLTALGVDAETSLSIVDQLQRRSLDIAAFRDVSDADAFRAVISGITGETEPLKRFGIVVNETAVKAELLKLGFEGASTGASESAKVIARTNIILRQSGETQGQVAREADTLAEKEKRARAEFVKAAEDFGQKFLPVAADVLEWAVDALDAFNNLPSGVQNAGIALLALVAASGPIAGAIKGLQALIAAAVAARAALAAVAGSTAAGAGVGAAGGAAAGATMAGRAARVGAAGAAVGAGVLIWQSLDRGQRSARVERMLGRDATMRDRTTGRESEMGLFAASDADLEGALKTVRSDRNNYTWRTGRYEERIQAEITRRAEAMASAAVAGASGPNGDFGLSEAQKAGTGTGAGGGRGGGRGGSGHAERIAEARARLDLERAIAMAQASGDEAAVRAAEEREDLARLIKDYADAGSANAEAEATAHLAALNQGRALAEDRERIEQEIDDLLQGRLRQMEREDDFAQLLNDRLMDQLAMATELARVSGDQASIRATERRIWVEERINELLRLRLAYSREEAAVRAEGEWAQFDAAEGQSRFRDLVISAGEDFGGLMESAGDRFKRRALEGLADQLWKILNTIDLGGGSGGGGNGLGTAIMNGFNFLFGARASGGPVRANKPYIVGENGPEIMVPSVNGNVLNSVRASNVAARAAQEPMVIKVIGEEGASFYPRVQAISGNIAVQTTATGVAYAQNEARASAARRRQRFV